MDANDIQKRVKLTPKEEQLFNHIIDFVNGSSDPDIRNCELRVAGGWVRDKILGMNTDDIDITVSNMTGYQFASAFNEYIKANNIKSGSVAVIKANPEQSKHLETATVRILDMQIDFCNLRKETYDERSRIPKNEIGTAFEDAERRDLTINSLFYNIITKEIEDFTGKGIEDIIHKRLRTPLDPLITLMEDPLRVIRIIRFACKLNGFKIDDAVIESSKDPKVLKAFDVKLSKERKGKEIENISVSPRPELGIWYIVDFGLYYSLLQGPFEIKGKEKAFVNNVRTMMRVIRCLTQECIIDQKIAVLASIMEPFRNMKIEKLEAVEHFLIACLKFPRKVYENVKKVLSVLDGFKVIMEGIIKMFEEKPDTSYRDIYTLAKRSDIGLLLRTTGELWLEPIMLSALHLLPTIEEPVHPTIKDPDFEISHPYVRACLLLKEFVEKEMLLNVWDMKPLLNGNEIMKILNVKGSKVREVIEQQIIYMLDNPKTTKEECESWMVENFSK